MCAYIRQQNFMEIIVIRMSMAFVHVFSRCNLFNLLSSITHIIND